MIGTSAPLKRVATIKARVGWKGLTSDEFEVQSYAYLVTGRDFRGKYIDWKTCYQVSEDRFADDPFIQLRNGDILVTKDGSIGKVAVVDGLDKPACLNSGVFVVRPRRDLDASYLYWIFQSEVFSDFIAEVSRGSTIQHLYQEEFREMRIPVRELAEQQAIADYLDPETAQIDAFIAKNEELIALLTERRAASIDDAFNRLDVEATRLKYCAAIQTGVTLGGDGDPADPEWPYLRVANVQVGRVDLEDVKTIRVPEARARQSMLSVGDVLMTEGGDRDKLGRGALWSGDVAPMLHQNHVFAVKVGPNLNARFLMRWLDASPSREYFETTAVQTTNLASTNKTLVGNLPLPSCSVEAQLTLVELLDSRLENIDETIAVAERSVKLARERRAALISSAVTGKINVGVAA